MLWNFVFSFIKSYSDEIVDIALPASVGGSKLALLENNVRLIISWYFYRFYTLNGKLLSMHNSLKYRKKRLTIKITIALLSILFLIVVVSIGVKAWLTYGCN